jgi:hypothetical protein
LKTEEFCGNLSELILKLEPVPIAYRLSEIKKWDFDGLPDLLKLLKVSKLKNKRSVRRNLENEYLPFLTNNKYKQILKVDSVSWLSFVVSLRGAESDSYLLLGDKNSELSSVLSQQTQGPVRVLNSDSDFKDTEMLTPIPIPILLSEVDFSVNSTHYTRSHFLSDEHKDCVGELLVKGCDHLVSIIPEYGLSVEDLVSGCCYLLDTSRSQGSKLSVLFPRMSSSLANDLAHLFDSYFITVSLRMLFPDSEGSVKLWILGENHRIHTLAVHMVESQLRYEATLLAFSSDSELNTESEPSCSQSDLNLYVLSVLGDSESRKMMVEEMLLLNAPGTDLNRPLKQIVKELSYKLLEGVDLFSLGIPTKRRRYNRLVDFSSRSTILQEKALIYCASLEVSMGDFDFSKKDIVIKGEHDIYWFEPVLKDSSDSQIVRRLRLRSDLKVDPMFVLWRNRFSILL